jgi:hypothetical protein
MEKGYTVKFCGLLFITLDKKVKKLRNDYENEK